MPIRPTPAENGLFTREEMMLNIHRTLSKVGVFVDCANMYRNGGFNMQYDILRQFACRDGSEPMRLNAYVAHDVARAQNDGNFCLKAERFHSVLRDFGYKVIIKEVKWYTGEDGEKVQKANVDLDLAIDALLQSENLDRVVIASGDGDFVRVVHALQNKGCRVEVVALMNASLQLRREADLFISGFVIPGLIPTGDQQQEWGTLHSTVRGWCYYYNEERGIGFMRFLKHIQTPLWLMDKRKDPESPYEVAFFHVSAFRDESDSRNLPDPHRIFEFGLGMPKGKGKDMQAMDIVQITS